MKAYPASFLQVFWWVAAVLVVSGLALLPNMLEVRLEWTLPFTMPSGSRVWLGALHALFAFGALIVFGALIPLHVRNGLRGGKHLKSGVALLAIVFGLPLTALGIYYLSNESMSKLASIVHVVFGVLAAGVLTAHVVVARRAAARSHHLHHRHPHTIRPVADVAELDEHKRSAARHAQSHAPRHHAHRR